MFYFVIVGHYGLKTTNQFLRHSKCQKGSPNDRLEGNIPSAYKPHSQPCQHQADDNVHCAQTDSFLKMFS